MSVARLGGAQFSPDGQSLVGPDGPIQLMRSWSVQLQLNFQRVLEKFNRLTDWTVSNGANATATLNSSATGPYGTKGIKFSSIAVAGQSATTTKNLKFNLNLQNGFWLTTNVAYRQAAAQLGLTLYTSHLADLNGGSGRFQFANPVFSGAVSLQPIWVPKAGWSVLDGSPTWANDMLSMRVRMDTNASEPRDWTINGAFTGGARPTVIVTNDDGWDTDYTVAFAQAQKRNIPISHYLIPELIGVAGFVTLAQAQEMRANGDYLGLHGALRWDEDVNRIATDVAGLQAIGIDIKHAAYPEGRIGDGTTWLATTAMLASKGVKTARLAGGASPTLRFVGDTLALTSYPLNNSMTLANAKLAVDAAIASGGTVIFYGHKYGASADSLTWVTSDFTDLLDYINQKRLDGALDVTTIDKWYDGS